MISFSRLRMPVLLPKLCPRMLSKSIRNNEINVAIIERSGDCSLKSFPIKHVKTNLGLHYRDVITLGIASDNVQKIDSNTHSNSIPSLLLPRDSCILACFGNVRAAILVDKVVVFDPNLAVSKSCIRDLCSHNFAGSEPFEHQVLEELLKDMCNNYDRRVALYNSLYSSAISLSGRADEEVNVLVKYSLLSNILRWNDSKLLATGDESIHRLSPIADMCYDLTLELNNAQSCLNSVLQSPEQMSTLMLTFRSLSANDSPPSAQQLPPEQDKYASTDEVSEYFNLTRSSHYNPNEQWSEEEQRENIELLLDNYILRLTYTVNHVRQLQQKIKSKQELADLSLKITRNRLLWLNVNLAATAVCMGMFSGAIGIYGMNLPSGLEASKSAFFVVTGGALVVSAAVYYRLLKYMYGYSGPDNSASKEQQAIEERRLLIDNVLKDSPTMDILLKRSYQHMNNAGSGGRITRDQFAQLYSEVRGKQNVEERAVDAVFELIKAKSSGKEDLL
jgi:hypothetical protein